jgi:hypothetical protein
VPQVSCEQVEPRAHRPQIVVDNRESVEMQPQEHREHRPHTHGHTVSISCVPALTRTRFSITLLFHNTYVYSPCH